MTGPRIPLGVLPDATAVKKRRPTSAEKATGFASTVPMLLKLVSAPTIKEDVESPESFGGLPFLDSLRTLAGGSPISLEGSYQNRGYVDPFTGEMGLVGTEVYNPVEGYSMGFSPGERRAALTHEYGHIAHLVSPALLKQFIDSGNPALPAEQPVEAFADAFSTAARNAGVGMGNASARQYPPYKTQITPWQQAILDSVVKARMPLLNNQSRHRDALVTAAAIKYGVPPQLAIALSTIENTRGLPKAKSAKGAVGLMQVMPGMHSGTVAQLEDPAFNADIGVKVLAMYKQRYGSWDKALRAYNGSLNLPNAGDAYVKAVHDEMKRRAGAKKLKSP